MNQNSANPLLTTYFEYNEYVLKENLLNVTHEESIQKQDNHENCINWILGHILVEKDVILEELGEPRRCTDDLYNVYTRGNSLKDPSKAVHLDQLIKEIQESEKIIKDILSKREIKNLETSKSIAGLAFHEAYHAGQIGMLRKFLGKESKLK